jgi:hypothetical protein
MAGNTPTQKPVWINDDGSIARVVYTPIDANAPFTPADYLANFSIQDTFRNANKADLSQLLFGDDRVEATSDREFNALQKNFSRDVVRPQFNAYVTEQTPNIINLINAVDPEQTERFLLGKNRQAKTSVFRLETPANVTDRGRDIIEAYNGAADAVQAYHAEVAEMEEQGDMAYVQTRLNNITPMQMAVIMSATGSRPNDASKIARSYKTFHAAKALEKVRGFGVPNYVKVNLDRATRLETSHRNGLEAIEANTEAQLATLGPGATRDEVKPIYREAEAQKEALTVITQNAGTDAKYLFTDLSSKANDAATEYIATRPAQP